MKSILADLTESRLYPTRQSLKKETFVSLCDATYIMILALRVLLWEEETEAWAKGYLKKTYRSDYDVWRSDGTDLYVALYALTQGEYGGGGKRNSDATMINRWFKSMLTHTTSEDDMRRLFLRMDSLLHVQSSGLRSLRRAVMDYPELTREEQESVITRLLIKVRAKPAWIELAKKLRAVQKEIDDLRENASSGATSSASVATVVGGLGAGFDPNGDKGIYQSAAKPKKPIVLKR